jgi:hypothetical protein
VSDAQEDRDEKTHAVQEDVDNRRLKDVPKRDPVHETEERLERRLDERRLLRLREDLLAKLENLGKLARHLVLEVLRLGLGQLLGGEVEDLFGEKLENDHVVLAERQVRLRRVHELRDEVGPVVRPLLLQDLGETHERRGEAAQKQRYTCTSAKFSLFRYAFCFLANVSFDATFTTTPTMKLRMPARTGQLGAMTGHAARANLAVGLPAEISSVV